MGRIVKLIESGKNKSHTRSQRKHHAIAVERMDINRVNVVSEMPNATSVIRKDTWLKSAKANQSQTRLIRALSMWQ